MSHVLDSDGVSTHLFQCLAKDTRKLEAARVFIPTTIVFESGFASAWYYSTSNMEVKQQTHKSITAQMAFDALVPGGDACTKEIVAAFIECPSAQQQREREQGGASDSVNEEVGGSLSMSRRSAGPSESPTKRGPAASSHPILTSYFNAKELKEFLFSPRQKPRGILQRFEYPKGWCNSCIQVTWSPAVTMCEAVRNPHSIGDRAKSTADRCSTFESKLATPMALSNSATAAIGTLCELLVAHLQAVEPVQVTGMLLHVKVTGKNRVTLLYSTCLRVVARKAFGGLAGDPKPIAVGQSFMTRAEYELQQELQAHLAIFGPKPRLAPQLLQSQTHHQAVEERVARNPAGTPQPHGSPPRRLVPLSSTPTPSPGKADLYRSKVQNCCSALVAPKLLPSLVQIGGSRWIPGRGKLEPIEDPKPTPARQQHQPTHHQEQPPALGAEDSTMAASGSVPAHSRVSFQVADEGGDRDTGDASRSRHHHRVPSSEAACSASRQDSGLSVASDDDEVDSSPMNLRAPSFVGDSLSAVADVLEDLLYDLQRRATEIGSAEVLEYTAAFRGALGDPDGVAEINRVFAGFEPTDAIEYAEAEGIPVCVDRTFSVEKGDNGNSPKATDATILRLSVSGIGRRKAFAGASVKLRALLQA